MHQQGRFVEAERFYKEVLRHAPEHFDALHLLGVLSLQTGETQRGVGLIAKAIEFNSNFPVAHNNLGNGLKDLRRYHDALASYDKAISLKPNYAEAHLNQGDVLMELKRFDEALAVYQKAITLKPDYAVAFNNRGNALRKLKRFEEALASYDEAIVRKPDYADAFNNRGVALQELNRLDEALTSYDKAIALKPDNAEAIYNRGIALQALKCFDEALTSYDRAIALKPDYAVAFNNRGGAFGELKRFDEALASYDKAIALNPDYADAFNNRGVALQELKRFDEALLSYDKAISLKPDNAEAFYNRGIALQALKRIDDALASYAKAIALKPDYADAFNDRGNALNELKRFEEALASYEKALTLKPEFPEVHHNLGVAFGEQGRQAEAVIHFERAVALKPNFAEAKFAFCMAQLPILYRSASEITERRAAYQECLKRLCEAVEQRSIPSDWAKAIGSSQPFFLAYQGYNDRDLQSLYGSLVCQLMAERYPSVALSPPPRSDELVRVGIVSGFFRHHTVWKLLIRGWLSQFDRRRFRIFGYYTGFNADAETTQAIALCDRFVQGPLSIDGWRQAILDDAPHVLIYPEVGMDAVSAQLAAQRLAPVQCNSWGHPDTSGFPTLDYYLSSDLMEPPDAQDHYTESLVRLPNLSIYYEPLDLQPVSLSRADLGLRATATTYWCGQSLFKYLPQFDQVFPRIAREVGDCQFTFIGFQTGGYVTDLFRERLDETFAAFGLRAADYCVFLPRREDEHWFVAAVEQCDIALDSIGWSGGISTLESLHHSLPIVTMAAPLMRGRHSMAILKMLGVEETITETVDDYVSAAIRLARDVPWRMAIKRRISENKHRVYRDTGCVSALQEFLISVARRQTTQQSIPAKIDGLQTSTRTPLF